MIRPLADRILVEPLDPPLSTVLHVIEQGREGRHTRGRIIACGPKAQDCQVGDIIHFTDLFKFPLIMDHGQKRLILQEADICGIEEEWSHSVIGNFSEAGHEGGKPVNAQMWDA